MEGVPLFVRDFLEGEFLSAELRQGISEAIIIDCERPKRASLRLLKDGHGAILEETPPREIVCASSHGNHPGGGAAAPSAERSGKTVALGTSLAARIRRSMPVATTRSRSSVAC